MWHTRRDTDDARTRRHACTVLTDKVDSTVNDDRCRRHFHDMKYEKWSSHNFQGTGLINHLTTTLTCPDKSRIHSKPSEIFGFRLSLKASRKCGASRHASLLFIYLSFFLFLSSYVERAWNRSSAREREIENHLRSPFARIVLAFALFVLNITITVDY